MNTTDVAIISVAIANFVLQICLVYDIYRHIFKRMSLAEFRKNRIYVLDAVIHAISLVSFGFFLARQLPIWGTDAWACFYVHAVVMVVYEMQLGLFTFVQFLRYIAPLKKKWTRLVEILLIVVFVVTTVLNGYGQNVFIAGNIEQSGGQMTTGACDFKHDPIIALATAAMHAGAEFGFLLYFYRYIDAICVATKVSNRSNYSRMLRITIGVQAMFGLWVMFISGINFANAPMPLMATVYNVHFTLVLMISGMPHLARSARRAAVGSSVQASQPTNAERYTPTVGRNLTTNTMSMISDTYVTSKSHDGDDKVAQLA